MSSKFNLALWVVKLPSVGSCVVSTKSRFALYDDEDEYIPVPNPWRYYALAEDMRGQHCPYPMLPRWAKRLFDWRCEIALRLKQRQPIRGVNWWFHCPTPECHGKSFYTYRAHRCWECGWFFGKDLRPVSKLEVHTYQTSVEATWVGGPDDPLPF